MSKDARAKAIAVALDIRYAHAFRLMREFFDTNDRPITKDEVVSTVVARYREKQAQQAQQPQAQARAQQPPQPQPQNTSQTTEDPS